MVYRMLPRTQVYADGSLEWNGSLKSLESFVPHGAVPAVVESMVLPDSNLCNTTWGSFMTRKRPTGNAVDAATPIRHIFHTGAEMFPDAPLVFDDIRTRSTRPCRQQWKRTASAKQADAQWVKPFLTSRLTTSCRIGAFGEQVKTQGHHKRSVRWVPKLGDSSRLVVDEPLQ